jgi:hypothetical protein
MGKPKGPKMPEVGLVFPTDKKGGRCVSWHSMPCRKGPWGIGTYPPMRTFTPTKQRIDVREQGRVGGGRRGRGLGGGDQGGEGEGLASQVHQVSPWYMHKAGRLLDAVIELIG